MVSIMGELLLVGGDFNEDGGRRSSLIQTISNNLLKEGYRVKCINGGSFEDLRKIYDSFNLESKGIVLWFPNVPNDEEKLREIKTRAPKIILVASKRNNNEYSMAEMTNRMLLIKANLWLEFSLEEKEPKTIYRGSVFDPLGNRWVSSTDFEEVTRVLAKRLRRLEGLTRQNTVAIGGNVEVPNEEEFFEIIKRYANTFHQLIQPVEEVTRFLGNASFRCERGFPSFRLGEDVVFVSRRNVDKRYIDKNNFVAVCFDEDDGDRGTIYYYGPNKPSVDTPIQVRLYKMYPQIRYMLHSHCYIEGAPFTSDSIPCGAIEEVEEVSRLIEKEYPDRDEYFINLKGHGSLILTKSWQSMRDVKYVGRPLPEIE